MSKWLQEWAREHPRLALLLLVWWLGLALFVVWMFVDDWMHGIR